MNRIAFLRSLTGKGLIASLLPAELRNNPLVAYKHVLLYSGFVAGFRFYDGVALIKELAAGSELDLIREPLNIHDPKALAVHWGETKLGFLSMQDNLILSNLIDANVKLYAEAHQIHPHNRPWEMLEIAVYLPYPESELRPS